MRLSCTVFELQRVIVKWRKCLLPRVYLLWLSHSKLRQFLWRQKRVAGLSYDVVYVLSFSATCDGQQDRHTAVEYTVIAERRALKFIGIRKVQYCFSILTSESVK